MAKKDDISFLEQFRHLVDDYLVLGYAPAERDVLSGVTGAQAEMKKILGAKKYEKLRRQISQMMPRAKQLAALAKTRALLVQYPAPAIGGPIISVHMFDAITSNLLEQDIPKENIFDIVDQAIGAVRSGIVTSRPASVSQISALVSKGFVFIAMPMVEGDDPRLEDVHEAIKEVGQALGLVAERVDDPETNRRITDRILESLAQAEFVVVDLTHGRPNVYFEAGVAHGLRKLPIYIAQEGTRIEFDLKDYPVIFFKNITDLKNRLKKRLAALGEKTK